VPGIAPKDRVLELSAEVLARAGGR